MGNSTLSGLVVLASVASATIYYVSQQAHVTAVRAGKLFDPIAGKMLSNQVILIEGERITAAGSASDIPLPPGYPTVIDLSSRATVLPGLD